VICVNDAGHWRSRAGAHSWSRSARIAPVAGSPPNSGDAMLAIPAQTVRRSSCAASRSSGSATTADSSDSIAPSIAMVDVGEISVQDQIRPEVAEGESAAT
jgi:hypothetical protein